MMGSAMMSHSITSASPPIARVAATAGSAFRLGAWRVEPGLGRISTDATERVVEPKVMDVLVHLAARPGEVVSADELIASVWHGRPMGDNPVHRCVSILRRALGDDAHRPRYIGTVPKRGYRVVAPVETVRGAPAALEATARSIPLRIDIRSAGAALSDPRREEASARVPNAIARSAEEVFECVLRIGGLELRISAVLADSAETCSDWEASHPPSAEHLVGIVRRIACGAPPAVE